ncbi:myotubularin-related protein 14-like, partial [Stegodyphus dumicola]|uniref:myotubularin-related protein 14-like n=1 Tax=Stegodyphus dumicola TaxID=202533 RepID=UPI0015B1A6FF
MAPRAKRARVERLVTKELLKKIIKRAAFLRSTRSKTYKEDQAINNVCFDLISQDYECAALGNAYQTYCPHYPEDFLIPFHKDSFSDRFVDDLEELLNDSLRARLGSRFPIPVILYEGKYICRSSACHENAASLWRSEAGQDAESWQKIETYGMTIDVANYLLESLKYLKALQNDANLLRHMGVDYICDLRIRNFSGLSNDIIKSPEDVYTQVYQGFIKALLPYPTVDFFVNFHDNMSIEDLKFDWTKVSFNF